jgi:hypothetical protein
VFLFYLLHTFDEDIVLSDSIDFKKLEKDLWQQKESVTSAQVELHELPPASIGLASIRMKRWTRRLITISVVLLLLSSLLWFTKTHHVLRVSTQDGVVKSVELLIND